MLASVEEVEASRSAAEVKEVLGRSLGRFGLTAFLATILPERSDRLEQHILLDGWPPDWRGRYLEKKYYEHDPIARHCAATSYPFVWSEIPAPLFQDPRALRVLEEAAEFGLSDGFCVPVHGLHGPGGVWAAGEQVNLIYPARRMLHLLSIYAYGAAHRMHRTAVPPGSAKVLTNREREILMRLAEGRPAHEVADLLSISYHTVVQHLTTIRKKLRTQNTVHSVAEAVRRKLLVL
jgi:LuxR family transcriptional regulator, quorum-sensing system regulator BjaR1